MRIIGKKQLYFPALLILVAVLLLLVWISISTYRNFNRDREQSLEFVYRQGVAIIHTIESGIHTGLMMPQWNRKVMARFIEETGKNKDIAYIYLYDNNGRVLYHSLPSLEQKETAWTPALSKDQPVTSRVRPLSNTSQIYDLAKRFSPLSDAETAMNTKDVLKIYPGWSHYDPKPSVIVLGMNLNAFEEARTADFHHAVIMAVIVIALGCGALFFLFVIQNYYLVDRTLEETRDYTKEVEERARQSEKLAAVGKLAAGVAHEIRNPLSSIRGFAQFLSRSLADRPREKEYADIMVKEVDRINNVVSDLLTLSRPAAPELVLTDIEKLVSHAVRLVEDDAKSRNIQIHLDMAPEIKKIPTDANQMTQVLLNLLLNALQALETGGHIVIGVHPDKRLENLLIWVTDDGPGIPPEMCKNIFDPFVTTREVGNGLGLAIVRTIVESHMGNIRLESPPPGKVKGSRFAIALPMGDMGCR